MKKINLPRGMPAEAARLRERTLREARAAAALSSPHVVTVFDILPATPDGSGHRDGTRFMLRTGRLRTPKG